MHMMKRKTDSRVLEPHPCDSVSRSEVSEILATQKESQPLVSVNTSCKRFKGSLVNGYIVYTRKSRVDARNEFHDDEKRKRVLNCGEANIFGHLSLVDDGGGKQLQNVKPNAHNCESTYLEESKNQQAQSPVGNATAKIEENRVISVTGMPSEVNGLPPIRILGRYRPRRKLESIKSILIEPKPVGGANSTTASTKIVFNRKPLTCKELFDTGLLDGVPVVYMGGKKVSGLRGIIRDGGILCSCSFCNWRCVIPPSQFEIHACKAYKRAAEYICLENGKSLLELLRTCRGAPLQELEATVRKVLTSPPEEKYFTCKRCRVSFPPACVTRVGSMCDSCAESEINSQVSLIQRDGINTRSLDPISVPTISDSSMLPMAPQVKSQLKTRERSSKLVTATTSPESARVSVPSVKKRIWKKKKSSKKTIRLKSSKSSSKNPQNKTQWRVTKKHQKLHKLVFEEDGLPDGTEVAYYARGQKLLVGYKMGSGILCQCCNCEVSPSLFEAHAGWASRRKPYAYIYTSNGVSLHELAISLSRGRKFSAKDNDDLCIICWDGGKLVLCDGCPRAFHKECASLSSIPRGNWYCQYCQNMFEREKFVEHNENAVAAGRVAGVDSIEQISKRCIRIVKNVEAEISGCILCRGYDFSKSGFGPRTIILCDQCEKEYHVGCLRDHKMAYLKELPKGKWFCTPDCSTINMTLSKLLNCGAEKLQESLLYVIKNKMEERGLGDLCNIDVRWRILNGKIASPENRPLLSEAVSIFHGCFDPIVDPMSGRDLIPAMVYGRNVRGQEFGGMYCAILIVNSVVVSAGLFRIFGREIAEMPLVATRSGHHGKGYFQTLFSCIGQLIACLNIRSLVLPAAEEAESIWTDKFGFHKISADELSCYRKICCQIVSFKGSSMLQKMVPCRVVKPES